MNSPDILAPPVLWRNNRAARRISLRVDAAKRTVIVTLPRGASRKQGMAFLQSQAQWLEHALQTLPPRAMESGVIFLEGREIQLLFNTAHKCAFLDRDRLYLPACAAEKSLEAFLRDQARKILPPIVEEQAARMGLVPQKLSLRNVKSRWGSCTHQGGLMLNWRLVMAPAFVSHYVVVHELAHLQHFNHGPDFWALVDKFTNDNKAGREKAEKWLKEYGTHLLCCM